MRVGVRLDVPGPRRVEDRDPTRVDVLRGALRGACVENTDAQTTEGARRQLVPVLKAPLDPEDFGHARHAALQIPGARTTGRARANRRRRADEDQGPARSDDGARRRGRRKRRRRGGLRSAPASRRAEPGRRCRSSLVGGRRARRRRSRARGRGKRARGRRAGRSMGCAEEALRPRRSTRRGRQRRPRGGLGRRPCSARFLAKMHLGADPRLCEEKLVPNGLHHWGSQAGSS